MLSNTTETQNSIQYCFIAGICAADIKTSPEKVLEVVEKYKKIAPLGVMAMYDGYIRRKHGLVDSEGYEI